MRKSVVRIRDGVAGDGLAVSQSKPGLIHKIKKDYKRHKYLVFMAIPVFLWYLIFCYLPMFGISIAFMDYNISQGIFNSSFVGMKYFKEFLTGFYAWRVIRNTLVISVMNLIFSFPMPILLALLLNEVRHNAFKRTIQTISYLPYFISAVVVCGMMVSFTAKDGLFNNIIAMLGGERTSFLLDPKYFRRLYVGMGVWQNAGWGAIIYLAALAGIDQELYEAATIDGANRFQQFLHVTLPGVTPTIIIMLILRMGQMMSEGAEKIILLYNPGTYETADTIASFVYRRGIVEANYSYGTAVGLFNSVINLILLTMTNYISRRLSDTSLW